MKKNRKYTKEEIEIAVKNSRMYSEIFSNLGVKLNGGSYPWIKNLIKEYGITTDHFLTDEERYKIKGEQLRKYQILSYDEPLPNGCRLKSAKLKDYMTHHGVEYCCNVCELSVWMDKPITLDVDHVNSNPHDNRLENLQFICPNCHRIKTSNERKDDKCGNHCEDCGDTINKKSIKCKSCFMKNLNSVEKINKITWPTNEKLIKMVWEKPTSQISKELGVSDKAVEKRILKIGGDKPPRGYWKKYHSRDSDLSTLLTK